MAHDLFCHINWQVFTSGENQSRRRTKVVAMCHLWQRKVCLPCWWTTREDCISPRLQGKLVESRNPTAEKESKEQQRLSTFRLSLCYRRSSDEFNRETWDKKHESRLAPYQFPKVSLHSTFVPWGRCYQWERASDHRGLPRLRGWGVPRHFSAWQENW